MDSGKTPLKLAILWHMHQPPYEEPNTGTFVLPWTYLHALKDYRDMGEVIRRHPRMRVNVNFTPSLLHQIRSYETDVLRDQTIRVMRKDPARLVPSEQEFLLRTCLGINVDLMGAGLPRYRDLAAMYRETTHPGEALTRFRPQDYLDLSVLFLLAWCGPTLARDETVQALMARGRDFTPDDRDRLIFQGQQFVRTVIPLWKQLADSGQVELSASPFYHPLSPLLVSSFSALEASPSTRLPDVRFAAPEELERQLDLGLKYFETCFDRSSAGLWPPEGAVSSAVLDIVAGRGLRWIATDEEILRRSLGGEVSQSERFVPHEYSGVSVFFRDRVLSDSIGFVYSRWPKEESVRHFISELRRIADQAEDERSLVVIAMDGENAWEYYPDGGYPFLDALYGAIEAADFLEPVTFSEYLDRYGPGEHLDYLATGSWISGNLDTWIGDPVKNLAWSYLAAAYQVVRDLHPSHDRIPCESPNGQSLRCSLLRAEASDWFWWFGKGHSSIHEREFDSLFRQNLRDVYEKLGLRPPEYLDRPLGAEQVWVPAHPPTAYVSPALTGLRDNYYKWVGAGSCEHSHGSIHRLQPLVSAVRFGFDRKNLYFRVDGFETLIHFFDDSAWMEIRFRRPEARTVRVRRTPSGFVVEDCGGTLDRIPGANAVCEEILEMALPVEWFDVMRGGPQVFEFYFSLGKGDLELERFPWDALLRMDFDPEMFDVMNWFV